jgi:formylglycine-generating enzyme required for sulfatase activity
VAIAACSLPTSLDGLTGGAPPSDGEVAAEGGSTADGGSTVDGGSTADGGSAVGEAGSGDGGIDSQASEAGCPGDAGPVPIDLGAFCIDSTEVTNLDYQQFLAFFFLTRTIPSQPSECAWNTSFAPTAGWPYPSGADQRPVTFVDWCDAHAYCAWAGKHLCGKIGGGAIDPANGDTAGLDQWFYACSANGTRTWPYGNTYQPAVCNDAARDAGKPLDVGSFQGCQGGFPGLFDMSGSAEEWVDSCNGSSGASDECRNRGGATDDPSGNLTCGAISMDSRDFTSLRTGFRCCSR